MANKWRKKKFQKKKKGILHDGHKYKVGKPSKGLTPSRYYYKMRRVFHIPNLAASVTTLRALGLSATAPVDGNGLRLRWTVKLSDFDLDSTVRNMYDKYRINAFKTEIIPRSTTITQTGAGVGVSQLMVYNWVDYIDKYQTYNVIDGFQPTPESELTVLGIQRAKKRKWITEGGANHKIYNKCMQSVMTYVSPTDTDYTSQRPKFISTNEPDTLHYGLQTGIYNTNGGTLPTVNCAVVQTIYLECAGVSLITTNR